MFVIPFHVGKYNITERKIQQKSSNYRHFLLKTQKLSRIFYRCLRSENSSWNMCARRGHLFWKPKCLMMRSGFFNLNCVLKKQNSPEKSELWWSWWCDLNTRPADYESAALPTVLHQRTTVLLYYIKCCLSILFLIFSQKGSQKKPTPSWFLFDFVLKYFCVFRTKLSINIWQIPQ